MSTAEEDVSANGDADENNYFTESVDEVIRLLDELTPGTDDGGNVPPSFGPEAGQEGDTLSGEIVESAQTELQARPPNSYSCGEITNVGCCQHREEIERLKKQIEDAKAGEDQMAASLKDVRAENEELKEVVESLKDENRRIKRNKLILSTSANQVPVRQDLMVYSVEAPETQPPSYQQSETDQKKIYTSEPDKDGDTPWPGHTGDQQPAPQLCKPAPQSHHATPKTYQPAPQPTPQFYQLPPQPYQPTTQPPPQPYQPPTQPPLQPYQPPLQLYPTAVQGYPSAPLQYQSAPQVVPAFWTQQPPMQFHQGAAPPTGQPPNPSVFNITFNNAPAQSSTAGAHLGHPVAQAQHDPMTIHQSSTEDSLPYPVQEDESRLMMTKQFDTFKKTTINIKTD